MGNGRKLHRIPPWPMVLLFLTASVASTPLYAQIAEPDDADSKGDVSTENSPNLGQQKEQKVLQSEADSARESGKRDQETKGERQSTSSSTNNRSERPQRIERPPRPERPHR